MRIALVSDIHGNLLALEAVAADIRRRSVDQVVNLGDSLSGPLMALHTAQYLMASDWLSIAGNHERQMLSDAPGARIPSDDCALAQLGSAEIAWMAGLPPTLQLSEQILLCHGTPASDVEYFLDTPITGGTRAASGAEIEARTHGDASAVIACGHTHLPRLVRTRRGQLLINPGSVGLPAYDDVHPLAHVVETGSPDARYALLEQQGKDWCGALISVPYDHFAMARMAAQAGRHDWEIALLSGYMAPRSGA